MASEYDGLLKTRLQVQTQLGRLATPTEDKDGTPHQIPNPDYGRPLPDAPATPAYKQYLQLQAQDRALNDRMYALKAARPAPPAVPSPLMDPSTGRPAVGPGGATVMPLAPMPTTAPRGGVSHVPLGLLPGFAPGAPGNSPFLLTGGLPPGLTLPRGNVGTAPPQTADRSQGRSTRGHSGASGRLTSQQIHGASTGELLRRLAAKYR